MKTDVKKVLKLRDVRAVGSGSLNEVIKILFFLFRATKCFHFNDLRYLKFFMFKCILLWKRIEFMLLI